MKLPVVLLAASIALNAVLLGAFVTRPALAPPAMRDYFQFGGEASTPAPRAKAPASADAKPGQPRAGAPAMWSALEASDLKTFVARLRAAGFPPTVVRAMVDAEIERQFSGRLQELTREINATPYWKPDPSPFVTNSKLFEQINQIYRERARVLRDLLGQDAFAYGSIDATAAQRRQYGNLSPAKIDLVRRITDDYADMTGQVRMAMQGLALPEDREKLALLEREKHADLAAVLTPEELADYEMRTSNVTSRLRTAFTIMDASEGEFRTIYNIQQPFKDALYPDYSSGYIGPDTMEKRREATKQSAEQLKAALGDARYAEFQRASDSEFQQLYRLGQRDNTPYETLVRAYDIRAKTSEAAVKIVDDRGQTPDAKRAALAELNRTARTELLSTLGPTTGPTYVDNARWLGYLQQGRVLMPSPDGSFTTIRMVAPTPPPPPTPKK